MRKITLLFSLCVLLSTVGFGQCYWAKGMGCGVASCQVFGYSVKTDHLGNIYVGGRFQGTVDFDPGIGISNLSSTGQIDNFICKFNPNGNFIWAKKFGSITNDLLSSIFVDEFGNVISCGYFTGTADFDPGVGIFNLSSSGSSDIFVSKLDANGNFIWAKKIGGTGAESANSVTVDATASIIYTGFFNGTVDFDPGVGVSNLTSSGQNDIVISKLDLNGNFVWAKKIGGGSIDQGVSITVDSTLNIYTTGSFSGTVDFDPGVGSFNLSTTGSQAIYVNKLDSSGNFIWAKSIAGSGSGANQGNSIAIDRTLNIVTTGYFSGTLDFDPSANVFNLSSSGQQDIFVNKLDPNGNFVWAKKIGGLGVDFGNSIVADSSGFLYSTGYFENTVDFDPNLNTFNLISAGGKDIFINKMDPNGNFVWAKKIGGSGGGGDEGNSVTLDKSSNIITTGIFSGIVDFNPDLGTFNLTSIGFNDVFIHKINTSFVNPIIIPNGPLSFCTGGSVTLSSSYTTGNIWSNGVTTQYISTSNSGSFFVSNIDSVCFSSSDSISVVVNPLPTTPVITAGSSTTICQGNSVTLTSSLATSYLWSSGETTRAITTLSAGTYTVTVYNASGCSSSSNPVNIVVNPLPTAVASNTGPYCSSNFISLFATGGGTYSWSGPGGFTSTLQNPSRLNSTTAMAGVYTVTVTSSNGCTSMATTTVTVNQTPLAPNITNSSNTTFCQGDSVVLTSNYSFGNLWSTGATTQSITSRTNGYYWVSHNTGFCNSTRDSINVTVFPNSPVPTISASGPLTFCQGDSVTLTTNHPNTSLHFNTWFNGTTNLGFSQSITITSSGTYYVRYEYTPINGYYCPTNSIPVTVTVLTRPNTPTITASGPLTICSGNSVTLSSSSATGNIWSNGATTTSITVNTTGNYSLVYNNGTCNSLGSTVTVIVNPQPASPTGSASQTFCNSATISNLVANGTSIQWYSAASGGSALSSSTLLTNGTTYYATQTVSGCESISRLAVTVNINAPSAPTGSASQTFCPGATISNLVANGTSIQWYSTANGGTTLSSSTQLVNGTTYYAAQTVSGCQSNVRLAVTVSINVPAAPSGTNSQAFCSGATIANLIANGSNIQWYSIASGGTALSASTVLTNGGTYYASQTVSGCTSSSRLAVTVSISSSIAYSEICLVSVDNNDGKNIVIWEKATNQRIEYYKIYKQNTINSQYDSIAYVPIDSFSVFKDFNSNPSQQSDSYKISAVDSCGIEGPVLTAHTTIHLTANQGVNNNVNLLWNAYTGFSYPNFEIYRSNNGAPYTLIGTVANSSFSYTDVTPPAGTNYYYVSVTKPVPCNPAKAAPVLKSNSNILDALGNQVISSSEPLNIKDNIVIYPNPTKDLINISASTNFIGKNYRIFDYKGKLLQSKTIQSENTTLNLADLPSGLYLLRIEGNIESYKIVKL